MKTQPLLIHFKIEDDVKGVEMCAGLDADMFLAVKLPSMVSSDCAPGLIAKAGHASQICESMKSEPFSHESFLP
jgi:hypothetical protein